jgi:hypothetical protein
MISLRAMKLKPHGFVAFGILLASAAFAGDELPKTVLAGRGKLLVSEDFAKPVASIEAGTANKVKRGWRVLSGQWDFSSGALRGVQLATDGRSAFVVHSLAFREAVIQFDVRFDGCRQVIFRIQDAKPEHVCSVTIRPDGFSAQKDDHDHTGPDAAVPFGKAALPIPRGEWKTVLVEIKGAEMAATIGGKSITGTHPLIAAEKATIEFVVTGDSASFRNVRMWEAAPKSP